MHSHVHPFHVIINAHLKFEKWIPKPTNRYTLEIISSVARIWALLKTPQMAPEFLRHRNKQDNLGPPSATHSQSSSRGNSSGKRSDREDDEGEDPAVQPKRRRSSRKRGQSSQHEGAVPSLCHSSSSSRCSTPEPFNDQNIKDIERWNVAVTAGHATSPPHDPNPEPPVHLDGCRSPSIGGYDGWIPKWDTRWQVKTSEFSSNDWALYRSRCYLTGES